MSGRTVRGQCLYDTVKAVGAVKTGSVMTWAVMTGAVIKGVVITGAVISGVATACNPFTTYTYGDAHSE